MRFVIVAAAGLAACALLGACAGYRFPGGSASRSGTVTGQVLAVPCAPVEKANSPCQGRPVPNLEILFTSAGKDQVVTKTDSAGQYAVELTAGTWAVTLKSYMRVLSGPRAVTVDAGGTTVANYVVDSGIRLPAAAA
jgi:hypothetical protein